MTSIEFNKQFNRAYDRVYRKSTNVNLYGYSDINLNKNSSSKINKCMETYRSIRKRGISIVGTENYHCSVPMQADGEKFTCLVCGLSVQFDQESDNSKLFKVHGIHPIPIYDELSTEHKNELFEFFSNNPFLFKRIKKEFPNDITNSYIDIYINYKPDSILDGTYEITGDRANKAISKDPRLLFKLPKEYVDRSHYIALIKKDPSLLEKIPAIREACEIAFTAMPSLLLKVSGEYTYYAKDEHYDELVRENPRAILSVEKTHDRCDIAIQGDPTLIREIPIEYVRDYHYDALLNVDPSAIEWISQNQERCERAINADPKLYPKIDRKYRTLDMYGLYHGNIAQINEMREKVNADATEIDDSIFPENRKFWIYMSFSNKTGKVAYNSIYLFLKEFINGISYFSIDKCFDSELSVMKVTGKGKKIHIKSKMFDKDSITEMKRFFSVLNVLSNFGYIEINDKSKMTIHLDTNGMEASDISDAVYAYSRAQGNIAKIIGSVPSGIEYVNKNLLSHFDDIGMISTMPNDKLREIGNQLVINGFSHFYNNSIEFRHHKPSTKFESVLHWFRLIDCVLTHGSQMNRPAYFISSFFSKMNVPDITRAFYIAMYSRGVLGNAKNKELTRPLPRIPKGRIISG